eukprot:TRINITY_DN8623_c0_g1_i2.p1 TRINITY_DN8623_c0_g1~~TRINITY_DN8623_c0_g1_i2.p1  ORF type:complete len:200 (-),score=29.63 TRINITY_DN8623_c0_g1_i2:597-1196(-)
MSNPLARQLLAQTKKQELAQQKFEISQKEKAASRVSSAKGTGRKRERPIGSVIREVLQKLDPHKGLQADDLIKSASVDPAQWAAVAKELSVNPSVVHKDGLFYLKTQYRVRDRDALLKLVSETYEGIEADALREAYKGAQADLEALVDQRKLLSIVNVDTKRPVVYPLYAPYPVPISHDVKQLWASTTSIWSGCCGTRS